MKYILEQNNLFYITDGKMTRVIHLESWNVKDTTNQTIIDKVVEQGEEVASPLWD